MSTLLGTMLCVMLYMTQQLQQALHLKRRVVGVALWHCELAVMVTCHRVSLLIGLIGQYFKKIFSEKFSSDKWCITVRWP